MVGGREAPAHTQWGPWSLEARVATLAPPSTPDMTPSAAPGAPVPKPAPPSAVPSSSCTSDNHEPASPDPKSSSSPVPDSSPTSPTTHTANLESSDDGTPSDSLRNAPSSSPIPVRPRACHQHHEPSSQCAGSFLGSSLHGSSLHEGGEHVPGLSSDSDADEVEGEVVCGSCGGVFSGSAHDRHFWAQQQPAHPGFSRKSPLRPAGQGGDPGGNLPVDDGASLDDDDSSDSASFSESYASETIMSDSGGEEEFHPEWEYTGEDSRRLSSDHPGWRRVSIDENPYRDRGSGECPGRATGEGDTEEASDRVAIPRRCPHNAGSCECAPGNQWNKDVSGTIPEAPQRAGMGRVIDVAREAVSHGNAM
ncbi:hypothetical protein CYMTET_32619 [Cymbomonas tetramitiformis]|uniref:Uncharacterized protein n=1 Tax=Cymbomonas tetramitiformis TaxID=36881 RepID=A0AAE0KRR3_9CHLO|nr:hypothetical protein CYMTET_32619 [Cymbomonas tetramitiformis]